MKRIFFLYAALITIALTGTAHATSTWQEQGEAGQTIPTAQVVSGSGQLDRISGDLGGAADLFQIYITGGGNFSATTVGTGGTLLDSQLFLFDKHGFGVAGNDDAPGSWSLRSTLTPFSPLTPVLSGIYYLGIAGYDYDPVSVSGEIFPDWPFNNVAGPTGIGGANPLFTWSGFNFGYGTYNIDLTGAAFVPAPVPEPGTIALMGTGLIGIFMMRRKRQLAAID